MEEAAKAQPASVSSRQNRLIRQCHDELCGADAVALARRYSNRRTSGDDEIDSAYRRSCFIRCGGRGDGGNLSILECHDAKQHRCPTASSAVLPSAASTPNVRVSP